MSVAGLQERFSPKLGLTRSAEDQGSDHALDFYTASESHESRGSHSSLCSRPLGIPFILLEAEEN